MELWAMRVETGKVASDSRRLGAITMTFASSR